MKKILLTAVCIFIFETGAATAEKSEEELLRETVALSREVKEFGKTIGIEPSEALTKSTLTDERQAWMSIMAQRRGTLALDRLIDIEIMLLSDEQFPQKIQQYIYTARIIVSILVLAKNLLT